MTANRARFMLRYVFAHVEFVETVRYESDGSISVVFATGSTFNLTEIAEALDAQAPFLVADIRLIAPQIAVQDERDLAAAAWDAAEPMPAETCDLGDPEPLHLPRCEQTPRVHSRAG